MAGERRTTVTVRGVDRELYEELARLARETGRNVGEMLNLAMRLLLAHVRAGLDTIGRKVEEVRQLVGQVAEEQGALVVSGVEELTVGRRDLESAGRPVVFRGLRRLVFEADVDPQLFERAVRAIVAVDEVVVPPSLPRLLVAQKCRLVRRLVAAGR